MTAPSKPALTLPPYWQVGRGDITRLDGWKMALGVDPRSANVGVGVSDTWQLSKRAGWIATPVAELAPLYMQAAVTGSTVEPETALAVAEGASEAIMQVGPSPTSTPRTGAPLAKRADPLPEPPALFFAGPTLGEALRQFDRANPPPGWFPAACEGWLARE